MTGGTAAESRIFRTGRTILAGVDKGRDLLEAIEDLCVRFGVECGRVTVIGSAIRAVVAFYEHETRAYRNLELAGPLEIVSGTGNVSLKDGRPFCHLHLILSDGHGIAFGGHLVRGTTVFAAEVHLVELRGPTPERQPDRETGLNLWRFPQEASRSGGGKKWEKSR